MKDEFNRNGFGMKLADFHVKAGQDVWWKSADGSCMAGMDGYVVIIVAMQEGDEAKARRKEAWKKRVEKEKEEWAKAAKEEERRRLEVAKAAGYESVAEWEAAKAKGSCVCVVS